MSTARASHKIRRRDQAPATFRSRCRTDFLAVDLPQTESRILSNAKPDQLERGASSISILPITVPMGAARDGRTGGLLTRLSGRQRWAGRQGGDPGGSYSA